MQKASDFSVCALAYLGDAVLELLTREKLVKDGIVDSGKLNKASLNYVTATSQSCAVERVLPHLSEKEQSYYKRGRNTKGLSVPKSASVAEYRRATGLEVLFASLYVEGEKERINELFALAFPEEIN